MFTGSLAKTNKKHLNIEKCMLIFLNVKIGINANNININYVCNDFCILLFICPMYLYMIGIK